MCNMIKFNHEEIGVKEGEKPPVYHHQKPNTLSPLLLLSLNDLW